MGSRHTARAFSKIALLAAPLAAAALIAATASAYADDLTPQEKALVEAAQARKARSPFSIRNSATGPASMLGEGFIKRYNLGPNFKFNNLRKGTGATVAQTRQEIQAGKHTVDILIVSAPGFFDEASKRGAFEKLDSGYWKNHEEGVKAAGQYSNYPYVVVPFAYTFQPVWNSSCPGMEHFSATSYADVLKPELKGKTIASDLTKSFTYDNTALALEEAGHEPRRSVDQAEGDRSAGRIPHRAEDADGRLLPAAARHVEPDRPRLSGRPEEARPDQGAASGAPIRKARSCSATRPP